jgi:hypothetical protein
MAQIFFSVTALTMSIEKLRDDRATALRMGDGPLEDHFQTQIDYLRAHRKRLIDRILKK